MRKREQHLRAQPESVLDLRDCSDRRLCMWRRCAPLSDFRTSAVSRLYPTSRCALSDEQPSVQLHMDLATSIYAVLCYMQLKTANVAKQLLLY